MVLVVVSTFVVVVVEEVELVEVVVISGTGGTVEVAEVTSPGLEHAAASNAIVTRSGALLVHRIGNLKSWLVMFSPR